MSTKELEQIMTEHAAYNERWSLGVWCPSCSGYDHEGHGQTVDWPCLPYRLAEALIRTKADVADAWDAGRNSVGLDLMHRTGTLNPHRSEATA